MITSKKHQSQEKHQHAVVIGASMAGLLSARILLNHFDRVTVIERDRLPDCPELRHGVPQANHVHVLMVKGLQILEQLFPGITAELAAAGAPSIDWTAEFPWLGFQGWMPRLPSDLIGLATSRALLEWRVRNRLNAYDHLEFLVECPVKALLTDQSGTQVIGVALHSRNPDHPDTLKADFVVDASGRNSLLPKWLAELGYATPEQTTINSFLGYSTRWYERPQDFQADWKGMGIMAKPPDQRRGGIILSVEADRWVVSLGGIAEDRPPADEAAFLDYVKSLRSPAIYEAIKTAKPLSPVYCYRRTENCWRHYEKLTRLPEGLVTLGDAVCAFNPVYGQGMTTAALSALTLDQCLRQQLQKTPDLNDLSLRFQKQLAQVLKNPWLMATSEDFRWSTTVGGQPDRLTRFMHRYMDQVVLVATHQPRVWQTFTEVIHMLKPPVALFHPRILLQVLRHLVKPFRPPANLA